LLCKITLRPLEGDQKGLNYSHAKLTNNRRRRHGVVSFTVIALSGKRLQCVIKNDGTIWWFTRDSRDTILIKGTSNPNV